MYTWHKFLDSRAVPGADVYFDEIRFWLCGYPEGEPATLEQITKEEARLNRIQGKHDLEGYNAYKVLQVMYSASSQAKCPILVYSNLLLGRFHCD
jgi:hypothetical protein